jgi:hypothetical protein
MVSKRHPLQRPYHGRDAEAEEMDEHYRLVSEEREAEKQTASKRRKAKTACDRRGSTCSEPQRRSRPEADRRRLSKFEAIYLKRFEAKTGSACSEPPSKASSSKAKAASSRCPFEEAEERTLKRAKTTTSKEQQKVALKVEAGAACGVRNVIELAKGSTGSKIQATTPFSFSGKIREVIVKDVVGVQYLGKSDTPTAAKQPCSEKKAKDPPVAAAAACAKSSTSDRRCAVSAAQAITEKSKNSGPSSSNATTIAECQVDANMVFRVSLSPSESPEPPIKTRYPKGAPRENASPVAGNSSSSRGNLGDEGSPAAGNLVGEEAADDEGFWYRLDDVVTRIAEQGGTIQDLVQYFWEDYKTNEIYITKELDGIHGRADPTHWPMELFRIPPDWLDRPDTINWKRDIHTANVTFYRGYLSDVKAQLKHVLRVHQGEVRAWPPAEVDAWQPASSPLVATFLESSGGHAQTKLAKTRDERVREHSQKPQKEWQKKFGGHYIDAFSSRWQSNASCVPPDTDNAISGIAVRSSSGKDIFLRESSCITLSALFAYRGTTSSYGDLYTEWANCKLVINARTYVASYYYS